MSALTVRKQMIFVHTGGNLCGQWSRCDRGPTLAGRSPVQLLSAFFSPCNAGLHGDADIVHLLPFVNSVGKRIWDTPDRQRNRPSG